MHCKVCGKIAETLKCPTCEDAADRADYLWGICRRNECGRYGRSPEGRTGCLMLKKPCEIYNDLLNGHRCPVGFHPENG